MSAQLPFPAGWARQLTSTADPRDELAAIDAAKRAALAEIRAVLDRHAERFGIRPREVTDAITGYADNMIDDLFYETKSRLEKEIEDSDPV